ncbi:fumarate hydratase [Methanoplanus sp. FWC-SCC4]|uniref:Fumarate hydratase n=1 Tax=Methanochimaera problematica TaxID=2609417 RepID=A0AA97FCD1_9EURY|nr:fumarate hydratase [Methanoplanus sp. FWC-SCC4]WOF15458.1 fumarate hydratase [Methanoplanus sp. FWC-SCC4]
MLIENISRATEKAIREAEIHLPGDFMRALEKTIAKETSPVAKAEYENILENIIQAGRLEVPICQDTGLHIFFVTLPPEIPLTSEIYEGIYEGVRRANKSVPLRPNAVDPITRKNSGDNTGVNVPAVHIRPGEKFTITAMPKGGGSENMSRLAMFLPSETGRIKSFVVETMLIAGGRPCPPVVLGVGIGSTFDGVCSLAKEALLEPVDSMDEFEQEICDAVNELGIGPMGLGGDTTCIAVKVKKGHCHTASLPVAVNVQCWACRHATVEVEVPCND